MYTFYGYYYVYLCVCIMYRLFPCIPIIREFFQLKLQKECVYVIMLKITLVLLKNVFFGLKKGISG